MHARYYALSALALTLGLTIAGCGDAEAPAESEEAAGETAEAPAEPATASEHPATATLVSMEAGDRACYLELRDEAGATHSEFANFEVCELTDLVGKRVSLTYETGNIMAESCEGNPDCTENEEVQLVTAATALP